MCRKSKFLRKFISFLKKPLNNIFYNNPSLQPLNSNLSFIFSQDFLYLYDGASENDTLLSTCSGTYPAGYYNVSSTGNAILIHFTSDSDGDVAYPGFSIRFEEGKFRS